MSGSVGDANFPRGAPAWPTSAQELRARFEAVTPFAVGIEDEVMLVEPDTLELAHRAQDVLRLLAGDARFKLELPASQLEITIPPCATARAAAAALLAARAALASAADGAIRLAAAGTHPFSAAVGELNSDARHASIARAYGCVARRELVCALQVHVAVGHADRALAVYNAARSYLPQIAALAASAPFYEGSDSGLASVRPLIAALLPRQGVPPPFRSLDDYLQALSWGSVTGAFPDPSAWWWELRLHGGFGTLEFRVPDAQSTVAQAGAVAAVIQALVTWLGSRHDNGERLAVHPSWMIEENRWSACRDGVEGAMVDLETGRRHPTRIILETLLDDLADAASALQSQAELGVAARMAQANGAIAQREAARTGGARGVAEWLTERFLDPLSG